MEEKIEKDFNKFNSKKYLDEYYSDIGFENTELLKFFHEVYKEISDGKMLEFGGGPTIYQLISARDKATSITFSDYNTDNIQEVRNWVQNDKKSFNWDEWFKTVLELEAKEATSKDIEYAKNTLREKISELIRCDAYQSNPLNDDHYKKYFDIISTNFVPESATDNEKDYLLFLKNIFSLLKPGGKLIMTALKGAEFYHVGEKRFPAFSIKDEEYLKNTLEKFGFYNIRTKSIGAEHEQGYDGMIFLTADKE